MAEVNVEIYGVKVTIKDPDVTSTGLLAMGITAVKQLWEEHHQIAIRPSLDAPVAMIDDPTE